jgi:hypothetical protein
MGMGNILSDQGGILAEEPIVGFPTLEVGSTESVAISHILPPMNIAAMMKRKTRDKGNHYLLIDRP